MRNCEIPTVPRHFFANHFEEIGNLRQLLQRKRHIKMELCVGLSSLRLCYVGNVVQNRRSALSLAWHEWFSYCGLALSSEPQRWKFHVVICQTTSKIAPKRVQHGYFSAFNQSNHSFVALSVLLLSSFLKLLNDW